MSVRVTVNGSLRAQAEKAAQAATKVVMAELNGAFQQSFTAVAWSWPRQTKRSNGEVVGSPRNTIDQAGSGGLRGTGSWQMTSPYQATFKWSAEYATAVHEGYAARLRGGRQGPGLLVPARPWTRAVTGQENVPGVEVYNLGERLQNVWLAYMRARG